MQKNFLFLKIKSRLGLIHAPKGETDPNIGVETGPDYILSDEFVGQFPNKEVITFEFTKPERVSSTTYFEVLAKEYHELADLITEKLNRSRTLITAGGDHSISLGSVAAILTIYDPAKTGVIMIDSHGDLHQPSTSPSGNFHGMWLRPIVDQFEVSSINNLIPQKLTPKNLFYIGNLDIETEEDVYMKNNQIDVFSQKELVSSRFTKKLENFMKNMDHVHVSIDIDAFTHTFAPATGMVITNGLTPSDVFPILEKLKSCKSLSIDIVEVNPTMSGNNQTITLAQKILEKLI